MLNKKNGKLMMLQKKALDMNRELIIDIEKVRDWGY